MYEPTRLMALRDAIDHFSKTIFCDLIRHNPKTELCGIWFGQIRELAEAGEAACRNIQNDSGEKEVKDE